MDRKFIPAEETRSQIKVANSRFVATIAPVFSVEQAKDFVVRIRSEFGDASHNVPAYVIGHGHSVIAHCNDDGEPSGTAGRPALAVLQGSGLGDAAVVVTRYFGGTKLGTGGLVRAYGDAVKAVLADLRRAEKVATHTTLLAVPYNRFEQVQLLVKAHGGQIQEKDFAADITLSVLFRAEDLSPFNDSLRELSHGALSAVIVESSDSTIMPFGDVESESSE